MGEWIRSGGQGSWEVPNICKSWRRHIVLQYTRGPNNSLFLFFLKVHFDQFKDALILILSSTLTNEESFQQPGKTSFGNVEILATSRK